MIGITIMYVLMSCGGVPVSCTPVTGVQQFESDCETAKSVWISSGALVCIPVQNDWSPNPPEGKP